MDYEDKFWWFEYLESEPSPRGSYLTRAIRSLIINVLRVRIRNARSRR